MAGKTDVFENDILKLIFHGTAIANIADNAAASPLTALWLSLHTADPTDAAAGQTTNEATYTGYARKQMDRNSGAWAITGNSVSPVANVEFGECTAGTESITHVGIGTSSSGAGKLLYVGAITPSIAVSAGGRPTLTTASTLVED